MAGTFDCPSCGCPQVATPKRALSANECPFCGFQISEHSAASVSKTERGELLGWRAWYVVGEGADIRLTSTHYGGRAAGVTWLPDKHMTAECSYKGDAPSGKHAGKHAPDESCTCGFYAARTREHLIGLDTYHRYDRTGRPTVMGTVAMWGKVIRADNGFRAEHVRAETVLVPYEMWELVPQLKAVYEPQGTKIELDNTLAMPATDGPAWCADCGAKLKERDPRCPLCGTLNDLGGQ